MVTCVGQKICITTRVWVQNNDDVRSIRADKYVGTIGNGRLCEETNNLYLWISSFSNGFHILHLCSSDIAIKTLIF